MMRQSHFASGLVVLLAAAAIAGCGGSDAPEAPAGSPASTGGVAKVRACRDFAGEPRENKELTFAAGRSDDGVMGKLVNETRGTMWVRPLYGPGTVRIVECTLAAGASVIFSGDNNLTFILRTEAQDPDEQIWEYATQLQVYDPYAGRAGANGMYNRRPSKFNWTWEQELKEGQEGTFNWGATKIDVKRDRDGTFDSTFKSKTYQEKGNTFNYFTGKMTDWANFTITVKGLQSPPEAPAG